MLATSARAGVQRWAEVPRRAEVQLGCEKERPKTETPAPIWPGSGDAGRGGAAVCLQVAQGAGVETTALVRIPKAGHNVMIDQPQHFNAEVIAAMSCG